MKPVSTRMIRVASLLLVTSSLALALAACIAPPPDAAAGSAPVRGTWELAETPVERGEYLVLVGACDDCHTPGALFGPPDMARRLAGSEVPWGGPWGVTYGRNLTSDPETGLGKWSEDDIYRVLRHGVRPDGSVLLPPMPWQRFALMKEEDVRAVAAYLKTVPPVPHVMPPTLPPGAPTPPGTVVFGAPNSWDVPEAR